MVSGTKNVLEDKNQIVISKDMAIKYFSDEDPIGKTLSFKFLNGELRSFMVGGVLEEFPYNAGVFDHIIIPISHYFDLKFQDHYSWADFTDASFVFLKEGEQISSLEALLPNEDFVRVHKSFIVAIKSIKTLEGNRIAIGEHLIPIGQTYKNDFMKRINRLK